MYRACYFTGIVDIIQRCEMFVLVILFLRYDHYWHISLSVAMQPKQLKWCDHVIVAFSFIYSYLPSLVKPQRYNDFGTLNTQAATLPSSKLQNNTSVSYHCDLIRQFSPFNTKKHDRINKKGTQKQNKDLSPGLIKSQREGAWNNGHTPHFPVVTGLFTVKN